MDEFAADIHDYRHGDACEEPQSDRGSCPVCGRSKDEVHIRRDGTCERCHNYIRYHTDPEYRRRQIAMTGDYHRRHRDKANAATRKWQAKQREKGKQ